MSIVYAKQSCEKRKETRGTLSRRSRHWHSNVTSFCALELQSEKKEKKRRTHTADFVEHSRLQQTNDATAADPQLFASTFLHAYTITHERVHQTRRCLEGTRRAFVKEQQYYRPGAKSLHENSTCSLDKGRCGCRSVVLQKFDISGVFFFIFPTATESRPSVIREKTFLVFTRGFPTSRILVAKPQTLHSNATIEVGTTSVCYFTLVNGT